MPIANFMLADLAGSLLAVFLFVFTAYIPGYVIGWYTRILDFRSHSSAWRSAISIPLSVAIAGVSAFWVDMLGGRPAVWALLALSWILACALFAGASGHPKLRLGKPGRISRSIVLMAVGWTAVVLLSLADLQYGNRLYTSVTAYDHTLRTAMTDAITRTSMSHPENPYYYINGSAPLRYHYFWFNFCSLIDQLGGAAVSARNALNGSIVWCGIALACVICLYLRYFTSQGTEGIQGRAFRGVLLLGVTGLDIIPNVSSLVHGQFLPDPEFWNGNAQVTAWLASLIWVPNHVGGLISGLTGFLLIWYAASHADLRQRIFCAFFSGVAFTNMVGSSIYVGLVFALFLACWTAITFLAGWRRQTLILVIAGLVTVLLAVPYLQSLAGPTAGPAHGGSLVALTVRPFPGLAAFGLQDHFEPTWKNLAFRLLVLPVNYFFEFGFFLIVGVVYLFSLRRQTLSAQTAASLAMLAVSMGTATFLQSTVISNNDLGWRGLLPAQFILLLWAVELLSPSAARRIPGWLWRSATPLLIVGVLTTVYSLALLRFSAVVQDFRHRELNSSTRQYAVRQVYTYLRNSLPGNALVQYNPTLLNTIIAAGLYSNRQTAAGDPDCGSVFGGDSLKCSTVMPQIKGIYDGSASESELRQLCSKLSISALVVDTDDPAWHSRESWVWKMEPAIHSGSARGYVITPRETNALRER